MSHKITYEQTVWQDSVGGKIQNNVRIAMSYASNTLININRTFNNANETLRNNVKYNSRANKIKSMRVNINS